MLTVQQLPSEYLLNQAVLLSHGLKGEIPTTVTIPPSIAPSVSGLYL